MYVKWHTIGYKPESVSDARLTHQGYSTGPSSSSGPDAAYMRDSRQSQYRLQCMGWKDQNWIKGNGK